MTKRLFGTKIGMTRIFEGDVSTPVTVIQILPNEVVEVKNKEKHGYDALKVACGPLRKKAKGKAVSGEYKKADVAPRQFLREIPLVEGAEVGTKVTVEILDVKGQVSVQGTSKGHGFAGVVKRWGFAGNPATHGAQKHRGPGAIGCRMDPGKVFKNKKMPGHFGDETITVRNLSIISIDAENNLVIVKGSVPGSKGGLVSIEQA